MNIQKIETQRLIDQDKFDAAREKLERNKLGQFATPPHIAQEIAAYSLTLLQSSEVKFIDPGIGTGSFFSALLRASNQNPDKKIKSAFGFDIDKRFVDYANQIWAEHGLKVFENDFTNDLSPKLSGKANLVLANPPYVRHHHLDQAGKLDLQHKVSKELNIRISGLAGLYCYFMLLSDKFLEKDSVSAWLIPSEFFDVNYGSSLKEYLLGYVDLVRIHKFDNSTSQFADALVSSTVIWFVKRNPSHTAEVLLTTGDISNVSDSRFVSKSSMKAPDKWSPLFSKRATESQVKVVKFSDMFSIKRGIATGGNDFFVLSEEKAKELNIPKVFLRPLLPGPKTLKKDIVIADKNGEPANTDKLYLFNCDLEMNYLELNYPDVAEYVKAGEREGLHKAYLCSRRKPWYSQEKREAPIFVCTYMGRTLENRQSPFRFILNESQAVTTNVYLMIYLKEEAKKTVSMNPQFIQKLHKMLNELPAEVLIGGGRSYGGGLHKLEPKELGNIHIPEIECSENQIIQ